MDIEGVPFGALRAIGSAKLVRDGGAAGSSAKLSRLLRSKS